VIKTSVSPATGIVEPFRLVRWVALCALAETLGMTAAASATLLAEALIPGPRTAADNALILLMIVGGGLIEGIALGLFQSAGLVRWLPSFSRRRWIMSTTLVAGLGWAAASAPAQFSVDGDSASPPPVIIIGGGLLLGALMGSVLGAAQAGGLRRNVRHPWRWIWINVFAWAPAMAVIFGGATTPDANWAPLVTLLLAAGTGAVAGAVLGFVSGLCWPVLEAPSWSHAFIAGLLKSRAGGLLDGSLAVLQVRGRTTGRTIELPAQYAYDGQALIILPGRPETKRWWRNLNGPSVVRVLLRGKWLTGEGQVLRPHEHDYAEAVLAYRARWPRSPSPADGLPVIVRVDLSPNSRTDGGWRAD
jgi:hypothetical protein